jgi:hypothetical protein
LTHFETSDILGVQIRPAPTKNEFKETIYFEGSYEKRRQSHG